MKNKKQNKIFSVGHLNVRSLMTCFVDLSNIILQHAFDVFSISESWLSEEIPDETVQIPGYKLFRRDRLSRGGGVAIFVRSIFHCENISVDVPGISESENIWIKLKLGNLNVAIGVIYRPPQTNIPQFTEAIDNILSYLVPSYDSIVVTGDVNINLLNLNNPLTPCFDAYGFTQVINEPTRVTQFSSTLRARTDGLLCGATVWRHRVALPWLPFKHSILRRTRSDEREWRTTVAWRRSSPRLVAASCGMNTSTRATVSQFDLVGRRVQSGRK